MLNRWIMCIIILGLQLTSVAYAEGDLISTFGVSDLSCGKYLQDIATKPQASNAYSWWIAGFVTGTNLAKGRRTSADSAAHEVWLKKYCQDHALDTFMKAAQELDKALDK